MEGIELALKGAILIFILKGPPKWQEVRQKNEKNHLVKIKSS